MVFICPVNWYFSICFKYRIRQFCLRHIAKKLKDNIRYQCTSEISVLMCVQQRHIQNHDSGLLFRCDDTPLL